MKIGFDRGILQGPLTGIGNYCLQMVGALSALDPELQFYVTRRLSWHPIQSGLEATVHSQDDSKHQLRAHLAKITIARTIYRSYRRRVAAYTYRTRKLTLFHAFNYLPLARPAVPMLPVVYDLSFVRYPKTHPIERLRWLSGLDQVIAEAPLIQTISEFSRREISDHYGYPINRIFVAYPAANPFFRPLGDTITQQHLQSLSLIPRRYFLAVGTLEPRKNLRTLITAYAALPLTIRTRFPLVLAGHAGWGELDLPPATLKLRSDGTLRFIGGVSNTQLRSLYEGARRLLFPSIYEGFGMPVVEALACGSPVTHSRHTSMDEITGPDGASIPALDPQAWIDAMLAESDRTEQDRAADTERCIEMARAFSWDHSAQIVRKAYTQILGSHEF